MRKLLRLTGIVALAVTGVFAGTTLAVSGPKVTGGAQSIFSGAIEFSLTANAIETSKGVKGIIQYSRENQAVADLFMHAKVQCYGIVGDGGLGSVAVVAGPCEPQLDPGGACVDWLVIWIEEGGTGSGDAVRVFTLPMLEAVDSCKAPDLADSFPGLVAEGEFKIRP